MPGCAQPDKVWEHRARQLLCSIFEPRQRDVTTALRQAPRCLSQGSKIPSKMEVAPQRSQKQLVVGLDGTWKVIRPRIEHIAKQYTVCIPP